MNIQCPTKWYNVQKDLEIVLPPPVDPVDDSQYHSKQLFGCLNNVYVDIPDKVLEQYRKYRPSILKRATDFEKEIGASCSVFYKYEGTNSSGSHKLNAAIPQVYYSKLDGFEEVVTATGAGQWGTAVAFAAKQFNIKCTIFMTGSTYDRMPERITLMKLLGANVIRSPIALHNANSDGSMALASSEAIEYAKEHPKTAQLFGLIMHQSIIGLEAESQIIEYGYYPDIVIVCVGGGTNFGGIIAPFLREKVKNNRLIDLIAVEPDENPSLTKGTYDYDYVDYKKLTPKLKVYTIGHEHIPAPIAAGGLRYHAVDSFISKLNNDGLIRAVSAAQNEILKAGALFYKTEGILPAPESSYAIYQAMVEAKNPANNGKTILFNISGHGHYDIKTYKECLS